MHNGAGLVACMHPRLILAAIRNTHRAASTTASPNDMMATGRTTTPPAGIAEGGFFSGIFGHKTQQPAAAGQRDATFASPNHGLPPASQLRCAAAAPSCPSSPVHKRHSCEFMHALLSDCVDARYSVSSLSLTERLLQRLYRWGRPAAEWMQVGYKFDTFSRSLGQCVDEADLSLHPWVWAKCGFSGLAEAIEAGDGSKKALPEEGMFASVKRHLADILHEKPLPLCPVGAPLVLLRRSLESLAAAFTDTHQLSYRQICRACACAIKKPCPCRRAIFKANRCSLVVPQKRAYLKCVCTSFIFGRRFQKPEKAADLSAAQILLRLMNPCHPLQREYVRKWPPLAFVFAVWDFTYVLCGDVVEVVETLARTSPSMFVLLHVLALSVSICCIYLW